MTVARTILMITAAALLGGCDYLGIQSGAAQTASREADGKAVGGACRHAGRAIEDCYAYNPAMPKAAVFAGWKAMNDYMVENKLDVVRPQLEPKLPGARRKELAAAPAGDKPADKHAEPAADKAKLSSR